MALNWWLVLENLRIGFYFLFSPMKLGFILLRFLRNLLLCSVIDGYMASLCGGIYMFILDLDSVNFIDVPELNYIIWVHCKDWFILNWGWLNN